MELEGKGGKERDKAANEALTEYDRAKAFYYGTQKKTSKTKSQEGADYFATPEPVGLTKVQSKPSSVTPLTSQNANGNFT
jgi:guanylate kinase